MGDVDSAWEAYVSADGLEYYYNTITEETTWDKPECLKGGEDQDSGDWFWIPDESQGYVVGQVLHEYYDGNTTVRTLDGSEIEVSIPKDREKIPVKLSALKKLTDDLVKLEDINDPFIVHNLRERCKNGDIYTYVGDILISINPYERLPIYTASVMDRYLNEDHSALSPHVFAIADDCFKALLKKEDQSVIISGESGAGKTEATKVILQYLAEVAGSASGVEQQVLKANPILESFGNAKTIRNNNSSRFGKWMEIHFDGKSSIIGCKIISYLLEKSRVALQAENERNFHVFYQLLAGADDQMRTDFYLGPPEEYELLNKSGCIYIEGTDDAQEFHENLEAMDGLNFSPDEKRSILQICAAILHLGNIRFVPNSDGTGSVIENEDALEISSQLLGVRSDMLRENFISRRFQSKGRSSAYCVPLEPEKAKDGRDSLCQTMFAFMFDWIVSKINSVLSAACNNQRTTRIGVLDIFGFEVFKQNNLEQFLINFANEKLQQFFNHQIFKLEQVIYEQEKIDWTIIEFKDNQECLDLIEQKRPPGIISILDEESKFPRATDKTFLEKLELNLSKHVNFEKPKLAHGKFIVKHFAGDVDYEVEGWREKNRDELPEHMLRVLSNSSNMFTSILYSTEDVPDPKGVTGKSPIARRGGNNSEGNSPAEIKLDLGAKSPRGGSGGARSPRGAAGTASKKGASKVTLGTQFKTQLQDMMDLLGSTEPYFIRCVKSNPQKICNTFDDKLIYDQLLYAGMLETIRIRRLGYPIRWTHEDFFKRFRVISPHVAQTKNYRDCAEALAKTLDMNMPHGAQVGLTKMFLKQEIANVLEDRRNHALEHIIVKLQQWWKMVSARGHFVEMRVNTLLIQQWDRMIFPRKRFVQSRKSAFLIQRWWRMLGGKKKLAELREKKRREEEEKRKKEEAARLARIKKVGEEQVKKEEELKRKLEAEQDEEERERIRALLAGEEKKEETEEKVKKKKKKKKKELSRTGSIMMDRNEVLEVPINVDGKMTVGLGWKQKKKFDMDASCLMFRYKKHIDDCYKFKPRSKDGAVIHKVGWSGTLSMISSIGGEGSDNHQIDVNLKKLSNKTNTLIFIVTLFTNGATFSEIEDSYVRLIDSSSKKEYCRYTIESSGKETAKIMCKLYRYGYTAWRLKAIGHPSQGRLYKHMISRVNPFLDPQPPKKRFKITIHMAKITNVNERRLKNGVLNTYCETRFDLASAKTKIAKKTLNPTWNTTHEVDGCASTIEITLMHKKGFSKQGFLARCVIEIEEGKKTNVSEEWFDFAEEDTAECGGQIKLSVVEW
mmetsp:Transcript_7888/g.13279  ORF Transcript_7888/g.13279 Transcript_7888/m.13279 type:complete len:1294 (-) Transcript_7888:21-3902(-)